MSPSHAHVYTIFPDFCFTGFSSINFPLTAIPVSSSNSRCAAFRGSSPSSNSPFGTDQAPTSLFFQKGPPGCTRKYSVLSDERRYNNKPALFSIKSKYDKLPVNPVINHST